MEETKNSSIIFHEDCKEYGGATVAKGINKQQKICIKYKEIKTMKKKTVIALLVTAGLAMTACGNGAETNNATVETTETAEETAQETEEDNMKATGEESDKEYPQLELSEQENDYVSDSVLLKKKIGMGPIVMKMFTGSDKEFGHASYRAEMDGMRIYTKFGEFNTDSDELYEVFCELVGMNSVEEMREKTKMTTLETGYINKYNCNYRVLECGEYGNILLLETYMEPNLCYFSFGFAYDSANVADEQLQSAVRYLADGMSTMTCDGTYRAKEVEPTFEEKLAAIEAHEKYMEEQAMEVYKLEKMTEEERQAYHEKKMQEAIALSERKEQELSEIEYVDYGEEEKDYEGEYPEGMEFSFPLYTEKTLPVDEMYMMVEVLFVTEPHPASLEGICNDVYEPIFRGYKPDEQKEVVVFKINKENCYGYYEYKTDEKGGSVGEYYINDVCIDIENFQGISYEEFVENYNKQNGQ